MTLSEELDFLVESTQSIPAEKRYWLIRTQAGDLYEPFRDFSFVALEHNQVPLSLINQLKEESKKDAIGLQNAIRNFVRDAYERRTKDNL